MEIKVIGKAESCIRIGHDIHAGMDIIIVGKTIGIARVHANRGLVFAGDYSIEVAQKRIEIGVSSLDLVSMKNEAVSIRGRKADSVYILDHSKLTTYTLRVIAEAGKDGEVFLVTD